MDGTFLPTITATSLLLLSIFLLYRSFQTRRSWKPLPPGPKNLPLIGSLHRMYSPPQAAFGNLSKTYGPLMYLRLGTTDCVVVSNAAMAKKVTATQDAEFASRPFTTMGKHVGFNFNGIGFAPMSPHIGRMRKLCVTELLSAERVNSFAPVRGEEIGVMVTNLWVTATTEKGRGVELRPPLKVLTANIMCRILFGKRYFGGDAELTEGIEDFRKSVVTLNKVSEKFDIGEVIPAIRWMDVMGMAAAYQTLMLPVKRLLQKLVDERRSLLEAGKMDLTAKDKYTITDILLSFDGEAKLPDVVIKGILFDLLAAGSDTTAVTVEWALAELLSRPDLLKRARKEIDGLVGKEQALNERHLCQLPFLQAVTKEVLRLHPPVPLGLPHHNEAESEVDGYRIPAKSTVFLNLTQIGRDPEKWDRPDEFMPQRFIDSSVHVLGSHHQAIPFGAGRRMCPGANFGFLTALRTLATLLHALDFEVVSTKGAVDLTDGKGVVCQLHHPLVVLPFPRLPRNVYH